MGVTEKVYDETHRLVEKYDVTAGGIGGGGEYVLQDGFGWTNGVYSALKHKFRP
jgi:alpha,alpha-trehalase